MPSIKLFPVSYSNMSYTLKDKTKKLVLLTVFKTYFILTLKNRRKKLLKYAVKLLASQSFEGLWRK